MKIKDREYILAEITKLDEAYASIRHESGTARVKISALPEEVQTVLGYNKEASEVVFKEELKKIRVAAVMERIQENRMALIQRSTEIVAEVISNTSEGVLCSYAHEMIFIETKATNYLTDRTYRFQAYKNGVYKYATILGASKTVQNYTEIE